MDDPTRAWTEAITSPSWTKRADNEVMHIDHEMYMDGLYLDGEVGNAV